MQYRPYKEKGSDRRMRKSARKSTLAYNRDLHRARKKKTT